jgi:predicted regulator of amino acid metabolism with ACT domain
MQPICQARALISYLAVQAFRMTGAEVARRLNIDRSSVSRAIKRVQNDPELMHTSKAEFTGVAKPLSVFIRVNPPAGFNARQ